MKINLICVGRTRRDGIGEAFEDYLKRATHYFPLELTIIPDVKGRQDREQQKTLEGKAILAAIGQGDMVMLLDERGRQTTSRELAEFLASQALTLPRNLCLIIGGPYGFSQAVYDRADRMWSLSKLTLPHDLARLFVAEQLYRAGTILRGEPYHHD